MKLSHIPSKSFSIYITFLLIITLQGCDNNSWTDIFIPKAVKTVRGYNEDQLKEKADQYEKLLDKRIKTSDKLGPIYQKLGDKYLKTKTWNSAIESYEKAIGYGRDSTIIHYSLGVAYANKGKVIAQRDDIDKAEYHYRRALEMSPDFDKASYGLSILLFYLKEEKEKGFMEMEKLVLKKKNNYKARFALGRFNYELNNPQKALSIYEGIYSDLNSLTASQVNKNYKKKCKKNIERLILELSKRK